MSWTKEDFRLYAQERRAKIVAYLGGCCVICGVTEDLQFDHIDPTQKSFEIKSNMTLSNPRVRAELAKCQLLCRSHHKEKTARERNWTHGTITGWMKKKCGCQECTAAKWAWHDKRNTRRRTGRRGKYQTRRS